MSLSTKTLAFLAGLVLATASAASAEPPGLAERRLDLLGDPLPWGVVARLGSARLAQVEAVNSGRANLITDRPPPPWLPFLAISPDGRTLAAYGGPSGLQLWDLPTGRNLRQFPLPVFADYPDKTEPYSPGWMPLAFSADGKRLAVSCSDGTLRLFDPDRGKEVSRTTVGANPMTHLAFAPDSRSLAGWTGKDQVGQILLWDLEQQREVRFWTMGGTPTALAFSADGKRLRGVSTESKGTGRKVFSSWDPTTGELRQKATLEEAGTYFGTLAPDGDLFAVPTPDGKAIRLVDPARGKEIRRLEDDAHRPNRLSFSGDGKWLASSSADGLLRVWEVETGKATHRIKVPAVPITEVVLSPFGSLLAFTTPRDKAIHLIDLAQGKELHLAAGHRTGPLEVAFAPDGKTVSTTSYDQVSVPYDEWTEWSLRRWDPLTGRELRATRQYPPSPVGFARFAPDGSRLLTVCKDGSVRLWDTETGQLVHRWKVPTGSLTRSGAGWSETSTWANLPFVTFSADSQFLVGVAHESIHRWEAATGKLCDVVPLPARNSWQRCQAGAEGRTVLFVEIKDHQARLGLLDLSTGRTVREFPCRRGELESLALSPDGRTAVVCQDGCATLWETASGRPRGRWNEVGSGALRTLAFSPDGQTLVLTGLPRGLVRLWHLPTGRQQMRAPDVPGRDHVAFLFSRRQLAGPGRLPQHRPDLRRAGLVGQATAGCDCPAGWRPGAILERPEWDERSAGVPGRLPAGGPGAAGRCLPEGPVEQAAPGPSAAHCPLDRRPRPR